MFPDTIAGAIFLAGLNEPTEMKYTKKISAVTTNLIISLE